jgi:hypothetical protein
MGREQWKRIERIYGLFSWNGIGALPRPKPAPRPGFTETAGVQRFSIQASNHGVGTVIIPQSAEFCTCGAGHGSYNHNGEFSRFPDERFPRDPKLGGLAQAKSVGRDSMHAFPIPAKADFTLGTALENYPITAAHRSGLSPASYFLSSRISDTH